VGENIIDTRRTLEFASLSLVGEVIWNILGYISIILIGRNFYAEGLGIFNILVILMHVFVLIVNLGFDTTSLRYLINYKTKNEKSNFKGLGLFSPLMVIISSSFVVVLLLVFSNGIAKLVFRDQNYYYAIRIMALSLPFFSLSLVFGKSLQSLQLVKYRIILEKIFQPIVLILWISISWYLEKPLNFMLCGIFLSYFLTSLFLGYFYYKKILAPLKEVIPTFEIKQWFKFALPVTFLATSIYLISWVSTLIVSMSLSASDAGVYSVAAKIVYIIGLPAIASDAMFLSQISRLHAERNLNSLQIQLSTLTRWTSTFAMLVCGAIFASRRALLSFFGADFQVAENALILLCLTQVIYSVFGHINGNILVQTGKSGKDLICVLVTLVYQIICGLIIIPKLGIMGAALTLGSAQILFAILRSYFVYQLFGFFSIDSKIRRPIFAVILSWAVCEHILTGSNLVISALIKVTIFLIFAFALIYIMGVETDDLEMLNIWSKKTMLFFRRLFRKYA